MKGRRAGADVCAVVFASEGIDRILPKKSLLGSFDHRCARDVGKLHLIVPHRTIHIKKHTAGVLTKRLGFLFGQRDVALNDFHGTLGNGVLLFVFQCHENSALYIIRNLRRRAADDFDQ